MESKNNWKAWLYLAPVLILMAVFTFYPIFNTFMLSFMKDWDYTLGSANKIVFTFDNYLEILTIRTADGSVTGSFFEQVVLTALPNTLLLTVITVPLSVIISLLIAIGLNSIPALKKLFQTIFFMPYVTNAIAIGMVFAIVFDTRYGVWNAIFGTTGHPWITYNSATGEQVNYWSALFAISFYIIWHSLPYKILIFLSGLQNIDQQYYEAAKIDGAGRVKTAWKVTVPLLSPQIFYILITSFIGAFKEYSSVIGLFGPDAGSFDKNTGPSSMKTMVYFVYEQIHDNYVQYASAAAVLLFFIILLFTIVQRKVGAKRVHY